MNRFQFTVDTNGGLLSVAQERKGLMDRFRRRERVDFDSLKTSDRVFAITLARIRGLDRDNNHHRFEADTLFLDHWMLSRVDDFSARVLGLPPRLSGFDFHAATPATVGSKRFALEWWWEKGGRQVQLNRIGSIVQSGSKRMRLPAPIFDAIELSKSFNSSAPLPEHWEALARFRKAIGMVEGDGAQPEGFLKHIEIVSCDRVGLSIDETNPSSFAPIPFTSSQLGEKDLASTESSPLAGDELETFKQEANKKGAQPAYKISNNRYLILDRSAMPVVDVISRHAALSEEEKLNFLENTEQIIFEAIEDALRQDGKLNELTSPQDQVEAVESAFKSAWAETREWAERVIEIRKWKKPEIAVPDGSGTSWLPNDIDAALGELLGTIPDEDLKELVLALVKAIAENRPTVPTAYGDVPALPLVYEALKRRLELYLARKESTVPNDEVTAFLPVTLDNFWELQFRERLRQRPQTLNSNMPAAVKQKLRPYQTEAFRWQVEAWQAGLPGILNADEQGLGKTLQTLSFLTWLSIEGILSGAIPNRPILIVAPTSLLRNWEEEIKAHLEPGLWGNPVRLYGPELRQSRKTDVRGRDIQDGHARLDFTELYQGNTPRIAITTYQTLANYAVSFTENQFSVVVFDEIQNVKNPATLRAVAAKAVNADFRIGLTGTPVENATRDLWAVMDQLFPGALGALTDFRTTFDTPKAGNMRALHAAIFQPQAGNPSLGLRRTKETVARELPTKTRVLHPRIMPPVQALRYDEARRPGQTLFGLLHHIRRTSLHPGLIEGEAPDSFTHSSARISAAMDILTCIKNKGERALVFVESLDVQHWFAELVKIEFALARVDIINGSTPISHRHEITKRFQRHLDLDEGFDVLILGPRAAGTGLTLTAANHVIHLTRWWNPAVEEQCNDRTHRIGQTRPVTIHIPLAIHPRLQRGSFDCLLQSLMRRKRTLADSILWGPESDESELLTLYEAIITADEASDETNASESLTLNGYPSLIAEEIDHNTLRISPRTGGASVIVTTEPLRINKDALSGTDAAVVLLASTKDRFPLIDTPISVLGGDKLWPEFVLPE
ncbi:DEAD/DEAH box helicase [Thalassospira mesophila]|uniref:DEAD/DEAH box helicase n=1 Tax=Thalassospira mesophila TaxID=1293891 RepID=UPI000A1E7A3B|nr:DEAD/DEAH box helicase [Thalassospira mesophila]